MHRLTFLLLAALTSCAGGTEPPELMTPMELQALPAGEADHRIHYGPHPSQFGDLRVPPGPGPHPVVVLVHGGCWKKEYASLRDIAPMGDALERAGIASWNIEYRRLGEDGGGWPGTYRDAAAAIDHLRTIAPPHRLDLARVVLVGHSAGAHLAHWAAARPRLPATSEIHSADPLPVRGIVNLAGRADMAADVANYEQQCRDTVVQKLLGGTPENVPLRYRDSSPSRLLPLGVPQRLIWGEHEEFVPWPVARSFIDSARRSGDDVELIAVPRAGHFETASPFSKAWPTVLETIRKLLG